MQPPDKTETRAMILTCGACGHRGEDGKDYAHDCYWVFRERGLRMAKNPHAVALGRLGGQADQRR